MLKVFFRINARFGALVHDGDAERNSMCKRPELFQAIDLLEWVRRQRDPTANGVPQAQNRRVEINIP